jgi:proline iminopeptidase
MRVSTDVYPEIEPFRTHRLDVGDGHTLHVEECGNPDGLPTVFLHGGPGGGAKPSQRRTFDPAVWRVVLFDQRGCGRSTPSAELRANDTEALVADIERVRELIGADRWAVTGGSWGSFLALRYAIAHPERCLGLRLHGVFLGSAEETRFWFHGIARFFPDAFEDFADHVPPAERDDLLAAYDRRLKDPDPAVHMPAALALRRFSARTQTLLPSADHEAALTEPKAALEIARLFAAYCAAGFFTPPGFLLDNVAALRGLPCEIVQGRYDVVTPMDAAWRLHRAWPEARFTITPLANHVATPEAPDLNVALADATDRLAAAIGGRAPTPVSAFTETHAESAPAVSADGGLLAWIDDRSGKPQIHIQALPEGDQSRRMIWPERIGALAFRPGGRDLLFAADRGGDERWRLFLLADGAATPRALTPDARFVHAWGCFDAEGGRIAFSATDRDPADMDVHLLDLETGERRCVLRGPGWRTPMAFSRDGSTLLVQDNRDGMNDAALVLLDLATGESRTALAAGAGARITWARWTPDGGRLAVVSNHGRAFCGVALLDPESGALDWIVEAEGDVEAAALSRDGSRMAYAVNVDGRSTLHLRDMASGGVRRLGAVVGRLTALTTTADGKRLIAAESRFDLPSRLRWFDLDDEAEARPPSAHPLATAPTPVAIPGFDGAPVPSFRFDPPQGGDGRALVWVHGGPESQFAAHWRADLQALVQRGWIVLAPNVRGSSGYGRDWMAADDRENRMDAVRDLKSVRDWLGAQPGVDPRRIALGGQSYGGFMTLAALTLHPEDWKVGVDFFGFADFIKEIETTGHWRRRLRAVEYGDAFDEADRPMLRSFSPVHRLDAIRAPLFIAHGLEDPRVPPGESETVATVLRGRGHPYELLRVPGEGHGWARRASRDRVYAAMIAFLERWIDV